MSSPAPISTLAQRVPIEWLQESPTNPRKHFDPRSFVDVKTDVCIVLPVDTPNMTSAALRALADACRDAAIPQTGPLPGAYRKSALPALVSGELSIHRAIADLDVAVVDLDDKLLVNVNTPQDLGL